MSRTNFVLSRVEHGKNVYNLRASSASREVFILVVNKGPIFNKCKFFNKSNVKAAKYDKYGNCSKVSNTFLFLFSSKLLVIRAGINKILVTIANMEDPDQTAEAAV